MHARPLNSLPRELLAPTIMKPKMRSKGCMWAVLALGMLCSSGLLGVTSAEDADDASFDEELQHWARGGSGQSFILKLMSDLENEPDRGIVRVVKFLRSNDDRLVRVRLNPEARGKQREFLAANALPGILRVLGPNHGIKTRTLAAQAIHLLSTENLGVAQVLGLHSWLPGTFGVKELAIMMTDAAQPEATEDAMLAGEAAGEALWALVTTSIDNLELAKSKGCVAACVDLLKSKATPRAKMWAAASLKHLFRDFYNTPDGAYATSARKTMDNSAMRAAAAADTQLVTTLVNMIKLGRVTEGTPRYQWPSHALVTERLTDSIQAWAAAGAVAAIASGPEGREGLMAAGVVPEVCTLTKSPDALEAVEGERALQELDAECPDQHSEL